jgi:hypothetical protein
MTDHIEVLRKFLPTNLCLDNTNVPDSTVIPLTSTMGELRRLRDAIAALSAREGGEADRRAEILRHERDHARACYENAVRILTGIHAVIYPQIVEMADGRKFAFNSPLLHEQMQALSDRIRAIPEELALHPAQPASQQEESRAITALKVTLFGVECWLPSDIAKAVQAACEASQQGEKWLRDKAAEMRMADADKASVEELCQYLSTYVRPHFALNEAHPTGDKVRGLVKEWQNRGDEDAAWFAMQLEHALDQEKNDGR